MTRALAVAVLAALALLLGSGEARAGYTHSWKWLKQPERGALARCVSEMGRIADTRREILADGSGKTGAEARFETTCAHADAGDLPCIVFNGIGDDHYEPFRFPLSPVANPVWSSIKTAFKPYDVVVVAALIVARDHFGPETLEIGSDGDWAAEWSSGAKLYTEVLGRRARDPMGERPPLPTMDSLEATENKASGAERYGGYVVALLLVGTLAYVARKLMRRG